MIITVLNILALIIQPFESREFYIRKGLKLGKHNSEIFMGICIFTIECCLLIILVGWYYYVWFK